MASSYLKQQRQAFLDAVLADPEDDAPRLIFADWLDEQGEGDRAELIRVQCKEADLLRTGSPTQVVCDRELLLAREKELLGLTGRSHPRPEGVLEISNWVKWSFSGMAAAIIWKPVFRRGFVDEVTMIWDDCNMHLDAILRQHPIQKVNLSHLPFDRSPHNNLGRHRITIRFLRENHPLLRTTDCSPKASAREPCLRLLKHHWPQVKEWDILDPPTRHFVGGPWSGRRAPVTEGIQRLIVPVSRILPAYSEEATIRDEDIEQHLYVLGDDGRMHYRGPSVPGTLDGH